MAPRGRSGSEPPLVSEIRSGRAIMLLLLYGMVASAGLLFLWMNQARSAVRSLGAAAGVALLFSAVTLFALPSEAVVVRAFPAASANGPGRMVVVDVVSTSDRTLTLSIDGLAKPLFDEPCRLVYDPVEKVTGVELLRVKARAMISFVAFQDIGAPAKVTAALDERGIRLDNGEAAAISGRIFFDGRALGRIEVPAGGQALATPDETGLHDAVELLIARTVGRGKTTILTRLQEEAPAPWREAADAFVERRTEPRYVVLRFE